MVEFMNKEKFLIVDDDPTITSNIGTFLTSCGYDVEAANDGNEALALFKTHRHPVILLDISMPGMNGLEVLEEIKKINAKSQVIMVSGNDDHNTIETAMRLGAYDFVTKPFVLKVLVRRVHMAYLENMAQKLNFKLNDGIVSMIGEFFKMTDKAVKPTNDISEIPLGQRNPNIPKEKPATGVDITSIIKNVTKGLWKE